LVKNMTRTYLNVPYQEKDEAKKLGARWDASARRWYVPEGIDTEPLVRWLPVEKPESLKPKSTEARLTVELVPQTCWYSNVRSEVSTGEWDTLKRVTFEQANYRCEVCSGRGSKHPVECHEIWHYDDGRHIQTLTGLIALCPACHECKHMGLANIKDRGELATDHLAKVNGWTIQQAKIYVRECFQVWEERSQHEWDLDITYLKQFGISIHSSSPRRGDRAGN
jgi:5-methylcytosine-specific restriction endonuclease McrA